MGFKGNAGSYRGESQFPTGVHWFCDVNGSSSSSSNWESLTYLLIYLTAIKKLLRAVRELSVGRGSPRLGGRCCVRLFRVFVSTANTQNHQNCPHNQPHLAIPESFLPDCTKHTVLLLTVQGVPTPSLSLFPSMRTLFASPSFQYTNLKNRKCSSAEVRTTL